jgi:hypothetical protein
MNVYNCVPAQDIQIQDITLLNNKMFSKETVKSHDMGYLERLKMY